MKKAIQILSVLFVLQLALIVVLYAGEDDLATSSASDSFLSVDLDLLDKITITDEAGKTLALAKVEGDWILPEHFAFPVADNKVKNVFSKLLDAKVSWPVGTTALAAKQFKVSDDNFIKKLSFIKGDKAEAVVYLGTTPAYKKIHARQASSDNSYAIEFAQFDVGIKFTDWFDRSYLGVEPEGMQQIEWEGMLLKRENDAMTFSDLSENQEMDAGKLNLLLGDIAQIKVDDVLGDENKDEYQQDKALYTLNLKYTRDNKEQERTYTFSEPKEGEYLVLKVSDSPLYFKTAKAPIEKIFKTKREDLIKEKEQKDDKESELVSSETDTQSKDEAE